MGGTMPAHLSAQALGRQGDMPILTVIMLLAGSISINAPALAEPCFHFEPAPASLVGKLVRKTFPGPPNYENIKAAGDRAETYWFVELREPICLAGTPRDEPRPQDVNDLKLVQLLLVHNEYKTHGQFVGKIVQATGTFTAGISGHHHTPVLLQVTHLEGAK